MANRFDTILAPDWMYTKFEKTPEGFLKGRAVICSTGIYEYRRADGSIVKELRLPEEVFAPAFLESLKLKPVTLGHPDEMVTVDNVQKYQKGTLGDNPSSPSGTEGKPNMVGGQAGYQFYNTDMYHVSIDMIIHDADTIRAIEDGTDELSVGYSCDLEPATPGARFLGQTYDYIQRHLIANHVAVVDTARAGDAARIRLDSDDAILVDASEHVEVNTGGNNMPDLKMFKIDGVEYSAEARVLEELHTVTVKADGLKTSLDALTTEKTQLEAKCDSEKDRADIAEAKVKELEAKKIDQAVIDVAVARKLRILDAARVAEVEVTDGMAEVDIQKAVITKVFPKAILDGKDSVYVDARFDGAIETLVTVAEITADASVRNLNGHVDSVELVDASKAREKYIERLQHAHNVSKE